MNNQEELKGTMESFVEALRMSNGKIITLEMSLAATNYKISYLIDKLEDANKSILQLTAEIIAKSN